MTMQACVSVTQNYYYASVGGATDAYGSVCVCPEPNLENRWKLSAGSCNASRTRYLMTIKYARFSI